MYPFSLVAIWHEGLDDPVIGCINYEIEILMLKFIFICCILG